MSNEAAKREWIARVLDHELMEPGTNAGAPQPIRYTALLTRWRDAQRVVSENLAAFSTAVRTADDVRQDPDFLDIDAALGGIADLVPSFGGGLESALETAMKGPDVQSGAAASKVTQLVRDAVSDYRRQLAAAPRLRELEALSAGFGPALQFGAEFDAALSVMETELARSA